MILEISINYLLRKKKQSVHGPPRALWSFRLQDIGHIIDRVWDMVLLGPPVAEVYDPLPSEKRE